MLPRAYLVDIEGTTTPIDFVTITLFPYARREMAAFLTRPTAELSQDLVLLSAEYEGEASPPAWPDRPGAKGTLEYLHWLMDSDRKSTGLKSIQGRIWQEGYERGELQGVVYPDVAPAFERWKARGASLYIYSSGSVLAQKLIFGCMDRPLTGFIDGYFDTEVGPKREAGSYESICSQVNLAPESVMFLSDVPAELEAASRAGLGATQVVRDGLKASWEPAVTSFDGLL